MSKRKKKKGRVCVRCKTPLPFGVEAYNLTTLGIFNRTRGEEDKFACIKCVDEHYKPNYPSCFKK